MFLRCLSLLLIAACAWSENVLRVCADPNNLPFSDQGQHGFENKIAALVAADMRARLDYTWWSERKSFAKQSLDEGVCDLVMGVPDSLPDVSTTQPYYRSTYVFLSRRDHHLQSLSLADPRLENLRIGIHVVGDDYAPPSIALARRGITKNIVAFSLYGSFGEPNPPSKLVDAVERGDIDVAVIWGPFAGYFAQNSKIALEIQRIEPAQFMGVPFVYGISAAVRSGNETLKAEVNRILAAEVNAIQGILIQYGLPQVR